MGHILYYAGLFFSLTYISMWLRHLSRLAERAAKPGALAAVLSVLSWALYVFALPTSLLVDGLRQVEANFHVSVNDENAAFVRAITRAQRDGIAQMRYYARLYNCDHEIVDEADFALWARSELRSRGLLEDLYPNHYY